MDPTSESAPTPLPRQQESWRSTSEAERQRLEGTAAASDAQKENAAANLCIRRDLGADSGGTWARIPERRGRAFRRPLGADSGATQARIWTTRAAVAPPLRRSCLGVRLADS